jgi:hypothetical protein
MKCHIFWGFFLWNPCLNRSQCTLQQKHYHEKLYKLRKKNFFLQTGIKPKSIFTTESKILVHTSELFLTTNKREKLSGKGAVFKHKATEDHHSTTCVVSCSSNRCNLPCSPPPPEPGNALLFTCNTLPLLLSLSLNIVSSWTTFLDAPESKRGSPWVLPYPVFTST